MPLITSSSSILLGCCHRCHRGYSLHFACRPTQSYYSNFCSHSSVWSTNIACKRCRRNGPFSKQRVRFLQPLLPCSQERVWAQTNSRSQTSESLSHATDIQNVNFETCAEGWFSVCGSERHILSHPNSPPITDSTFTKYSDTALTSLRQMGAGASWIRTGTYCSQVIVAQPSGASWAENQFSQEFSDSQTVSVLWLPDKCGPSNFGSKIVFRPMLGAWPSVISE